MSPVNLLGLKRPAFSSNFSHSFADRFCKAFDHSSSPLLLKPPRLYSLGRSLQRKNMFDLEAKKKPRALSTANSEPRLTPNCLTEFHVHGLQITDYQIDVPLDYTGEFIRTRTVPGSITLFFRVAVNVSKAKDTNLPYLLYLQGGPGFESPRPMDNGGWLKTASDNFRIVLMDQRGTGRSSRITCDNLLEKGNPVQQAEYLKFFRADSIVRDSEEIRKRIVPITNHSGRWSILGQSFGGFCCTTYLSLAPKGLIEVMMTGGIPPGINMACSADAVYQATYERVLRQNAKYYKRFPGDVERVQYIVNYLAAQPGGCVMTPTGNHLRPRTFQLLGLSALGFAQGFERLHFLIESAFEDDTRSRMSIKFLKDFDTWMSWDTNPLYAILHESIYCQGAPSNWAAHRIREQQYANAFDAVNQAANGQPVNFTGEMVFPWMFEDFAELRKVKEAADITAQRTDWPLLYDAFKLRENDVPVAALSYYEDMFVDFNLSCSTLQYIKDARQYVSSEWLHDGIRENGAVLFDRLLNMVRNSGAGLLR